MKEDRSDISLIQISRSPDDYLILSEGVQQGKRFVLVHQDFVDTLLSRYHRFIDHTRVFLFHLLRGEGAYPRSPTVHRSHNFLITLNCQFISHLNRLENIRPRSLSRREEAETQNLLLLQEHFGASTNEAVRKENRLFLHMASVPGIGELWPHHDKQNTNSAVPASLFILDPFSRAHTKKTGWSGDERPGSQGISSRMNRHIGSMQMITTHGISAAEHCAIVDSTIPVSLPGKSALLIMKERGRVVSQQYPDKVYAKAEEAVKFKKGKVRWGNSLHEGFYLSKIAEQKTEVPALYEGRQIPTGKSKKENQTELDSVQPVSSPPYDTGLTVLNLSGQRSKGTALSFKRPATLSEVFQPDRSARIQPRMMALPTIQVLAKSIARNPFDHFGFSLPQGSDHDLNSVTGAMPTLTSLHAGIVMQKAPVSSLGAVTYAIPAPAHGKGQGERTKIGSPPIGLQRPRPEFSHADDLDRPGIRLLNQARTVARQDVPNLIHPPGEATRESNSSIRNVDRKTETITAKTTLRPVITQQPDVHQTNPIDVQQIANRVYGLLVDRITRERKMRGALRL